MKPKKIESNTTGIINAEPSKDFVAEKCRIFGENMRAARKDRGFTSEALGRFLGISTAYVGLIERGERTPSLETFLKICEFFGESPDEMFQPQKNTLSVKEKKGPGRPGNEKDQIERKRKMVSSMINTFNQDELDHIIGVVKSFKNFSHKNNAEHQDENADEIAFPRDSIRGLE